MKTTFTAALIVGATLLASGAQAQDASVAVPSSAAPAVQGQPRNQLQFEPQNRASAPTAPAIVPSQTIYAARLPNPAELTDGAAKQGLGIDRIEQSATQVTVVYRYSDGQTKAVAYQLLPSAIAPTTPAPVVIPAAPVPAAPPPVVYYQSSPSVIYYDRGYYPYYSYPPVSLRLGFGFGYHGGSGFRHRH